MKKVWKRSLFSPPVTEPGVSIVCILLYLPYLENRGISLVSSGLYVWGTYIFQRKKSLAQVSDCIFILIMSRNACENMNILCSFCARLDGTELVLYHTRHRSRGVVLPCLPELLPCSTQCIQHSTLIFIHIRLDSAVECMILNTDSPNEVTYGCPLTALQTNVNCIKILIQPFKSHILAQNVKNIWLGAWSSSAVSNESHLLKMIIP